jgi:hypothetical protein
MGNMKTVKMIIKSIESTFIKSDEFLLLKAEIMVRTREWREATMAINGIGKHNEIPKEDWIRRIEEVKENIKNNEDAEKRKRLMSNQNQVSRNLFMEDEEINNATKLMWNRDYQEAVDAACKVWTRIMINSAPEMIFPKIKVLQIMIESTLSLTLSNLQYVEEWMETLTKLDYNGILTRILKIKLAMRKEEEEEIIAKEYMDTLKGIELIEDAIQRKDWYNQMEDLRKFYEEISGKTITIEIPDIELPSPMNVRQTLFSHEDGEGEMTAP